MQTVDWNGIAILLEQVRPPAGHPKLGLRPACSELQSYTQGAETAWAVETTIGLYPLAVYPTGIDPAVASAYLSADGLCKSSGVPIGVVPLASDVPPAIREQGYAFNNVSELEQLRVEQISDAPPAAVPAPDVTQGGNGSWWLLLSFLVLLLLGGGAAAYLWWRRQPAQPETKPPETRDTETEPSTFSSPASETPSETFQGSETSPNRNGQPAEFDQIHEQIQRTLGRINNA